MEPASAFAPMSASPEPARLLGMLGVLGAGGADIVAVRDGGATVIGVDPAEVVVASGPEALAALGALRPGWWAGYLAYDLGRSVEVVVPRTPPSGIPDLVLARFDSRLVLAADGTARVEGAGAGADRLRAALRARPAAALDAPALGPWASSLDREAFTTRVQTIIGLLEAGECYQVNLTRQLTSRRAADPLALFSALASQNPAPHGSLVRLAGVAVVSASPERFLCWDAGRVETRPIKGTARTIAALEASAKDRAENVMIVDLARNDLGRVCEPGSIQVPELFSIESHPGLFHLASTVRGRLRPEVGPAELIGATFPPASVTGAPKARVHQAIEHLEPVRRGVYCGAVGWIDTASGAGDLAVAIRTFTVAGGVTALGVGAGIVADSDPDSEWDETDLKAARLIEAAGVDPRPLTGARR